MQTGGKFGERQKKQMADVMTELANELAEVKAKIAEKDAEIERLKADAEAAEIRGGRAVLAAIKSVLGIA